MMALTGKPIKEATIEDLRRIEEHIKEYRAKMDNIDNPIAKGYFQMDIDISEKTREWIKNYIAIGWNYDLLMRKDGDWRHDTEVKPELLAKAGITPDDVYFILEDRDSMVAKWRELGYRCLQVNDGNF